MRKGFAITALISGILGLLAGVNEWFLNQYILHMVNWEGPLQALADISWFFETALVGVAVICLAIAVMMEPVSRASPTPPIMSASPPLHHPPTEQPPIVADEERTSAPSGSIPVDSAELDARPSK